MIDDDTYAEVVAHLLRDMMDEDFESLMSAFRANDIKLYLESSKGFNVGKIVGVTKVLNQPDAVAHRTDVTKQLQSEGIGTAEAHFVVLLDGDGDPVLGWLAGKDGHDDFRKPGMEDRITALMRDVVRNDMGLTEEQALNLIPMPKGSDPNIDRQMHRKLQAEIDAEVSAFRDEINAGLDDLFGGG